MSRYTIAPLAQADLDGVWEYIGITNDNPDAAWRQIEAIYERLVLLATYPLMGELREDLAPGLRSFVSGSYVIFYQPTNYGIDVFGVIHGARDIPGLFRRGERP